MKRDVLTQSFRFHIEDFVAIVDSPNVETQIRATLSKCNKIILTRREINMRDSLMLETSHEAELRTAPQLNARSVEGSKIGALRGPLNRTRNPNL